MDAKHYNELVEVSQKIYDFGTDVVSEYCAKTYGAIKKNTMSEQMEDYLFVAQETCAFFLGNALAPLNVNDQEAALKEFTDNVRRVISYSNSQVKSSHKGN